MNIRRFAVRAFGATAAATAVVTGIGGAAAAAPAPAPVAHLTLNGPVMPTLGQNAFCTGLVDTAIETDPARPGLATIALTSRGMRGVDPDWSRNPVCRVQVTIAWNLGVLAGQVKEVELLAGEQPGETIRTEINPGPGLAAITVSANYVSPWYNELRPQYGYPVSAYALIP